MKKALKKVDHPTMRSMTRTLQGFDGDHLRLLKSYISHPEFKILFNNILRTQAAAGYKSMSILSKESGADKPFFISALALAYTCYLQSRVLIVETVEQPRSRSLFLDCILEAHGNRSSGMRNQEMGFIDLLSTESFFEGERELADFQLGEHVKRAQEEYDVVLVNTAPLASHDEDCIHPLIISRYADQAILLVSPQEKNPDELEPLVKLIRKSEVPLLGVVEGPGYEQSGAKGIPVQRVIQKSYQAVRNKMNFARRA